MGVIAKYKFNNTLEANLLPEFNSEFTSDLYTVTDEVDGDVTTRTIESDSLPTLMRFGRLWVEGETDTDNRTDSLLEVLDMDTGGLTSCSYMFRYNKNLTSITCEWDTSNVTNMYAMFFNCHKLTSLNVSNFNTSEVTDMFAMFYQCNNLTSLDVSNWNTSNVTNMSNMFYGCNNLIVLDVSNFNTSNVTDMNSIFTFCKSLTTLDVSNFDTSKVTTMFGMFANMTKLTSLRCPNLNTDSLTIIGRIFKGNTNLVTLDISNLTIDTSVVTDYTEIFLESPNMKYIKCNSTDTINLVVSQLPTRTSDNQGTIICKSDTTNLDTATLSSINWNITDESTLIAKYVFDKSIHNNCIPEFNTEFEGYFIEDEVEEDSNEVTRTIESCGMLPTLMSFGSSDWINIGRTDRTSSLLEVLNIDTSGLTTMNSLFRWCNNLTSVNCDNWNTSNVTNMAGMFTDCFNLTSVDVSNWDTSKVTNMMYLFNNCNNLTTLDVSNFNTSNVTNMKQMFYGCQKITTLDLSNFDTNNVTNTTNMFYNTSLLTDIGVLYMDKSSLQKLVNAMPTDSNKTLWYKDVDIDGITHGNNITLKKYIEENVEIVLNSPLLEGDTIEVKDGKLCHYHKMGMVVLDGSENWVTWNTSTGDIVNSYLYWNRHNPSLEYVIKSDGRNITPIIANNLPNNIGGHMSLVEGIIAIPVSKYFAISIHKDKLGVTDVNNKENVNKLKQWLQNNPVTVIYELASPYYEDIIPLQSSLALRTFEECNIQIITALPIKTKITYRTNITSAIVMEQELDTLDSGVSLSNLIEEEVDE